MRHLLAMAVAVFAGAAVANAQVSAPPLGDLAALLDRHGYGDVRSLEAEGGALAVTARLADGRPARALVDERLGTVTEMPGRLLFVRYDAPAAPRMTFRELAALLDKTVPGGRLVELKRSQGAYEVHLRAADGKAVGMLVDVTTRRILPYHSLD
ncbi:MAG: hypothetical protein AB1918_07315 [Pseudomonadota bacterium]